LAKCIEDPRDPAAIEHSIAEMIRYRALLIAAGWPPEMARTMPRRTIKGDVPLGVA
jgi:hypothetical protein